MVTNDESPLLNTEVHYLSYEPVGEEFKVIVGRCFSAADEPPVVVYLPDADLVFGTAVEMCRLLEHENYVPPILVVGIGYRVNELPETLPLRVRDLTPTADPSRQGTAPEMMGGAAKFLAFIRDVLQPWVRERYDVHSGDNAYFGNSLGGLFGPTCC